jgi:hypothetical protein
MKINVNDTIKVKLKDAGRDIHRADWLKYMPANYPYKINEDAEGYSSWSIWNFMQLFGHHIYLGMTVPFDTDIVYEHPSND